MQPPQVLLLLPLPDLDLLLFFLFDDGNGALETIGRLGIRLAVLGYIDGA